jgi:hypothetical protein
MLVRLSLSTLVLVGLAGVANAQATGSWPLDPMARHGRGAPHKVAIVDEYGFRYDGRGNRLDASGHVIAPPHTQPGARVIQNGTGRT